MRVLVVCLNPTIQRTFVVPSFRVGEVNRSRTQRTDASGKGVNVARVLAQLGADVTHLTQSGGRDHDLFRSLAAADGMHLDLVETDIEIRIANTIIDEERRSTTELVEEGREVPADVEGRIRARFLSHLPGLDGLVISGSKAAGFSSGLFPWMVGEARRHNARILVDYRGEDLLSSLSQAPHYVKINAAEFVATFLPELVPNGGGGEHGVNGSLLEAVREKMLELHRDYGIVPMLTRGAHATLYLEEGQVREEHPIDITPVNTIGSGDAFAAGFLYRALRGSILLDALRFGHECAARNAQLLKPGSL